MLFKAAKVSIGDEVVDRPSNNVMIFDIEDELRDICRICMRTGQLINPCACQARYHQRCMLLYIRKVLLRSLAVAAQVNVTTVKCRMCNHQLRFLYYSRTLADCGRARQRLRGNLCNSHTVAIVIDLLLLIITVLLYLYMQPNPRRRSLAYVCSYLTVLTVQAILFFLILVNFLLKYLIAKQVILHRVMEIIDLENSANSSSSTDTTIRRGCELIVAEPSAIHNEM